MHQMMIQDVEIEQMLYKGEPVVTFDMIAKVHGVPMRNVRKAFYSHKSKFQEEKHFYHARAEGDNSLLLKVTTNPSGLLLFTQKGYLLLVKPMRDDRSWAVQEQMVDEYFALKEAAAEEPKQIDYANIYPESRTLIALIQQGAQLRYEIEQLRGESITQKEYIIALQRQHLDLQAQQITTYRLAEENAHNSAWMTIHQFGTIQPDMGKHFDDATSKALARHLLAVSAEKGYRVYKAQVVGGKWPNENTYCHALMNAVVPDWIARRSSQIRLVDNQDDAQEETI